MNAKKACGTATYLQPSAMNLYTKNPCHIAWDRNYGFSVWDIRPQNFSSSKHVCCGKVISEANRFIKTRNFNVCVTSTTGSSALPRFDQIIGGSILHLPFAGVSISSTAERSICRNPPPVPMGSMLHHAKLQFPIDM